MGEGDRQRDTGILVCSEGTVVVEGPAVFTVHNCRYEGSRKKAEKDQHAILTPKRRGPEIKRNEAMVFHLPLAAHDQGPSQTRFMWSCTVVLLAPT